MKRISTIIIGLFILVAIPVRAQVAPRTLLESKNANLLNRSETDPVATWEVPIQSDGSFVGPAQDPSPSPVTVQVQTNPAQVLQGNTVFTVTNPTVIRTITIPEQSGELSVLGQTISGDEIVNDTIKLGEKTSGNFVKTITGGSGLQIIGSEAESWTPTAALGNLEENWDQENPYDIVLANTNSEIRILGTDGSNYITIDAGSLTSDATLTLSGASGTLITSSNFSEYITSAENALTITNNLSDLSNSSLARTNLGLGSIATQDASSISVTGGTVSGITERV